MKEFKDYPRWLTPDDVCELLQISKNAFYIRIFRGDIPSCKLGKGTVRVDKYKLEKMLEDSTRGGTYEK